MSCWATAPVSTDASFGQTNLAVGGLRRRDATHETIHHRVCLPAVAVVRFNLTRFFASVALP